MLKLKKFFSLGLVLGLVGAVGLGVMSCVEPEPDGDELYTVTLLGGGIGSSVEYDDGTKTKDFYAGDTVVIVAGVNGSDVFDRWTTTGGMVFDDATSETTTFIMPAKNVTVTANWTTVKKYTATVWDGSNQTTVMYEEGDTVDIVEDFELDVFVNWVALDKDKKKTITVTFGDAGKKSTYFIMPKQDVFVGPTYDLGTGSLVRFTWEASQSSNIYLISASEDDVASWKEDVYEKIYLVAVDSINATLELGDTRDTILNYVSHIPMHGGSVDVPDNLFVGDDPSNEYKGMYIGINSGSYTAVCTVIDPVLKDTFDIVANYDIDDEELVKYFYDVGFDVGLMLSSDPLSVPENWVLLESYDNPYTRPYLEKSKAKSVMLLKVLKKDNVTYYVLRRPRK